ncbi:hypothetical protein NKH18_31800 [Streptomyces sp. M10(2022)]
MIKLAFALYLLGIVCTGLAPTFALVLVAQAVAAAGAALYIPAATVTAAALVGPERRGRAIATVTTGLTAATALGLRSVPWSAAPLAGGRPCGSSRYSPA